MLQTRWYTLNNMKWHRWMHCITYEKVIFRKRWVERARGDGISRPRRGLVYTTWHLWTRTVLTVLQMTNTSSVGQQTSGADNGVPNENTNYTYIPNIIILYLSVGIINNRVFRTSVSFVVVVHSSIYVTLGKKVSGFQNGIFGAAICIINNYSFKLHAISSV